MAAPYNIVVIVGSLRKEAYTLKVANALARLAPESLKLDVTTIAPIHGGRVYPWADFAKFVRSGSTN